MECELELAVVWAEAVVEVVIHIVVQPIRVQVKREKRGRSDQQNSVVYYTQD